MLKKKEVDYKVTAGVFGLIVLSSLIYRPYKGTLYRQLLLTKFYGLFCYKFIFITNIIIIII